MEYISTTQLATDRKIKRNDLFILFQESGYVKRDAENKNWILTTKGHLVGKYKTRNNEKWIIWPENFDLSKMLEIDLKSTKKKLEGYCDNCGKKLRGNKDICHACCKENKPTKKISKTTLSKNSSYLFKDIYIEKVKSSSMYANGLNYEHDRINRGRRGLETIEECNIYTALYGGRHFSKLFAAYQASKINMKHSKLLEITDYACGQGYATFILLEFLANNNLLNNTKEINIRLIDISSFVINIAVDYIKMLRDHYRILRKIKIQIKKVALDINSIEDSSFADKTKPNSIKVHLLSNILDIQNVNKKNLSSHVLGTYSGYNYFICVSPSYRSAESGFDMFSDEFLKSYPRDYKEVRCIRKDTKLILRGREYNFLKRKWEETTIKRVEKQFYINNL